MAGLNQPSSGKVMISESGLPVQPGQVGVVAQNYPLFEHRTVYSNLILAAKQHEPNYTTARDKVHEFLEEFDLVDKAQLYPCQLSGGQRQRAAIIQQVLCSEHYLLMDEPFSGLDPLMLEKTCTLLDKIANRDDLNTIIIVTHDVTAAAAISDHLWLMGRDTAEDGQKIPGSRIVKQYDLIERGLCWHPEIQQTSIFSDFVREVKGQFKGL
jgi:polar amino acid transport system ATP-binding protein/sulfate transport system ATP-binding protein